MSAAWTRPDGTSGAGQAVSLTGDTGYFWFFSANNVEMVIKVVDGRPVNSHFWVFAGGLTNVRGVITVTDTRTFAEKTYENPQGVAFAPIQDTGRAAVLLRRGRAVPGLQRRRPDRSLCSRARAGASLP